MTRTKTGTTIWILLLLVFGFAGSAHAQLPSVGVGYQALHLPDNWVNAGFNVDVAGAINEQLSIVESSASVTMENRDRIR
jgi:hypothetical protein